MPASRWRKHFITRQITRFRHLHPPFAYLSFRRGTIWCDKTIQNANLIDKLKIQMSFEQSYKMRFPSRRVLYFNNVSSRCCEPQRCFWIHNIHFPDDTQCRIHILHHLNSATWRGCTVTTSTTISFWDNILTLSRFHWVFCRVSVSALIWRLFRSEHYIWILVNAERTIYRD